MYTPFTSRHFTTHIDPVSKVRFAVLSTRVAPIQQGFYFTNSSWSDDGRYLWFYCAYPPAAGHSLAVIDFLTDEIHHFPDTLSAGATWLVDTSTGNVYWGVPQGIFMRTPNPADKPILIARIPENCRKAGLKTVLCVGTHLTFTPDRRELLADIQTNLGSVIGTFDIVTGAFTQWYQTEPGVPYNHAQICPTNGDICLCAHELSYDPKQGRNVKPALVDGIYPRLQVITRDGKRTMLKALGTAATHEWWAADGKSVYYCNGSHEENGSRIGVVVRNDLEGSDPEIVCRVNIPDGNSTWHAHCTEDEKGFVIDGSTYSMGLSWWRGCESTVHFYNRETGKLFRFLTRNPVVEGWTPENPCSYHIDPHPRFVLHDTMVVFTTTVCGRVDLAVAPVDQLIRATR